MNQHPSCYSVQESHHSTQKIVRVIIRIFVYTPQLDDRLVFKNEDTRRYDDNFRQSDD
ncbi:MAG: hypothetical protein V3U88_07875 [Methylococcales bacterium]